ncbi:MAG: DUF5009 domain-containing protein [Phaeodactylibacter sp.]|nr:DUF5009 domain-containing protein [Phaeodactylibacter sp.]MCB9300323.1 DUF5009 domain-containing protein [Lewinellaceae bacterium]
MLQSPSTAPRIASIDIFRALTMLLMIFVNDLWSLEGVPKWMLHTKAAEDGMGLSDVVFPAFLFIVGLSIPFAISNRLKKGDSTWQVVWHIGERTLALLVMGFFMVNLENIWAEGLPFSRYWWQIFMALAIFLIWNRYPSGDGRGNLYLGLKILGVLILLGLAYIYQGGSAEHPTWMKPHWWGILGLIGWAYLLSALVYLLFRDNLPAIVLAWLFFNLFNVAAFAGWLAPLEPLKQYVWIVGDGSMPALTMGGVVASVIYRKYFQAEKAKGLIWVLLLLAVLAMAYGFGLRPFWGISKIRATPAWIGICTGISFAAFAFLYWLSDIRQQRSWARIIEPAGTSTLTCYLIPYFAYAIRELAGLTLPMALRTGGLGLLKSLLFALMIVWITGLLKRFRIQLKI